jgi:acetylornithine deacetylase/succinyl-diaminopimelate desuccinylase-like protein
MSGRGCTEGLALQPAAWARSAMLEFERLISSRDVSQVSGRLVGNRRIPREAWPGGMEAACVKDRTNTGSPGGLEGSAIKSLVCRPRSIIEKPVSENPMEERVGLTLDYFAGHAEDFISDIVALVGHQSISTPSRNLEGLLSASKWISDRLKRIPLERVQVYETSGLPIVYGEDVREERAGPTVLFYGHYDVVSAGDPEEWKTDPFTATQVAEHLYGRGTSDMKGQIICICAALESLQATCGLPCNVKILLEGEEEHYSPDLKSFIETNRSMLSCDFCLSPDAGMLGENTPTIVYSLRGTAAFRLRVFGSRQDLHSGMFGGVTRNPIHVLCHLLAGLHDEEGRVAVRGFYDPVLPLTDGERLALKDHPHDEVYFMRQTGVRELWGEHGFTAIERNGRRPALETTYIHAGELKPLIPSRAEAGINVRIVPEQTPEVVHRQLSEYCAENIPPTVDWELDFIGGGSPAQTACSSGYFGLFRESLEQVWGEKVVAHPHGGSIPAVSMIQSALGVDTILSGSTLPDDHLHGPNERLHMPTWQSFTEALIRFLVGLDRTQA